MPGIPKKPYCQRCKDRRVKCDQKWPTCSACMRKGIECPGPTSLVKFVTNNCHKVRKDDQGPVSSQSRSQSRKFENTSLVLSGGLILAERPSQATAKAAGHGSKFYSFRLTNVWNHRMAMNSCERITARLATLMDASPEQSMVLFKPLRALPPRLFPSECLQYGVAYWCSVWVDFNCGLRSPSSTTWSYYAKLLRSLQQAIQGPQALSLETLTAAILLFKAGDHFNLETHAEKTSIIHQLRGIVALVKARGPPNCRDQLDALVSYECELIVGVVGAFPTHDADFYGAPEWVDARIKALEQVSAWENGREIDLLTLKHAVKQSGHGFGTETMRNCNRDPSAFVKDAEALQQEHRLFLSKFDSLFAEHWAYTQERYGKITEVVDPDFFVGKRFCVENHEAFSTLLNALEAPIVPCVMVSHLRELYQSPPDPEFDRIFRNICTRLWMFIPYIRAQDPLSIGDEAIVGVVNTMQLATEQEREHLVDFIAAMDVTGDYGGDRDEIVKETQGHLDYARGIYDPFHNEKMAAWFLTLNQEGST